MFQACYAVSTRTWLTSCGDTGAPNPPACHRHGGTGQRDELVASHHPGRA
jgi:hypothetical protein